MAQYNVHLLVLAGVWAVAALGACAVAPESEPGPVLVDPAFLEFGRSCRSFETVFVTFSFWSDGAHRFVLHADSEAQVGVDKLDVSRRRYVWREGRLTLQSSGWAEPKELPWADLVESVWEECRSGFSGSQWVPGVPWEA